MDQLLVSHVCEQGHHGDFGVGSTQLLTGAQQWGLCTLELEEDLTKQRMNIPSIHSKQQNICYELKNYPFGFCTISILN